jgi:hypothetical protein
VAADVSDHGTACVDPKPSFDQIGERRVPPHS